MSRKSISIFIFLVLVVALGAPNYVYQAMHSKKQVDPNLSTRAASPFQYEFSQDSVLFESGTVEKSTSPFWWVDSGGMLVIRSGLGQTIHGALPENDYWHQLYLKNNPMDTDGGSHPQNIFRLVTKSQWHDSLEEAYLKIDEYNLSESSNRNESNGLLLLSRYQNQNNLYYAGVRVDGLAVIKKKINGVYYTLVQNPLLPGDYDRNTKPILLPLHEWIGLRLKTETISPNVVKLDLYTDIGKTGEWKLAAEAFDDQGSFGLINDSKAFGGIRTDFMDVSIDNFHIEELD